MVEVFEFISKMVKYYTEHEGKYPSNALSIGLKMVMESPEYHAGMDIAMRNDPLSIVELLTLVTKGLKKLEKDR